MMAADIPMAEIDRVLGQDVSKLRFENASAKDSMLLSRRLTLVPLTRIVGYAIHVMV